MYSWYVDEAGAVDLAKGLGSPIAPGLIVAGLAGATPRGGASASNTLRGRIATMHLGKKHEFSTLRRSIGSILARAHGQPAIDEEQLTRWMHAHVRIALIHEADPDALDDPETEILADLIRRFTSRKSPRRRSVCGRPPVARSTREHRRSSRRAANRSKLDAHQRRPKAGGQIDFALSGPRDTFSGSLDPEGREIR